MSERMNPTPENTVKTVLEAVIGSLCFLELRGESLVDTSKGGEGGGGKDRERSTVRRKDLDIEVDFIRW